MASSEHDNSRDSACSAAEPRQLLDQRGREEQGGKISKSSETSSPGTHQDAAARSPDAAVNNEKSTTSSDKKTQDSNSNRNNKDNDKRDTNDKRNNNDRVKYLTDDEIDAFIDELDQNRNGFVEYSEVEAQLDRVHDEIAPKAAPHLRLHRDVASSLPLSKHDDGGEALDARHVFLSKMLTGNKTTTTARDDSHHATDQHKKYKIPRDEFKECVRSWKIPSMKQDQDAEKEEHDYVASMSAWRRARAYWAVHGPEIVFLSVVVAMHLGLGIWQCVKYATGPQYQAALGWGVVLAKTCAGALYASFFFLVISMSRYFSTFLRRFYHVSRFINWDLSQTFHIRMSIVALVLATLHAVGHLSGSFNWGSRPERQDAVTALLGAPKPQYVDYVRTRPGITGIIALGLFYVLAALSLPQVRKWNYQVFQLAHLLMFPILGCLVAHGTSQLLQWAMFGYFLAFPTLLITAERLVRLATGLHRIPARLRVLDSETVEVSATIPSERLWRYEAGQYVFLQVPELSHWQWHPFTVSACSGKQMWLHIKTDGDWTGKLRKLAVGDGEEEEGKKSGDGEEKERGGKSAGVEEKVVNIDIGINGPFGAPAQRFYDFTHTIVVGGGIGVTPFSGILADLQAKDDAAHGGPSGQRKLPLGPGSARSHSADMLGGQSHESGHSNSPRPTGPIPSDTDVSDRTIVPPAGNLVHDDQTRMYHLSDHPDRQDRQQSSRKDGPLPHRTTTNGPGYAEDYRRVDFHWMVRDRNQLLWFSDLLNAVSVSQIWHAKHHHHQDAEGKHLDINIHTHVTQKRKGIATHVYRWLLEMHRTEKHPESPLTGLINATNFGRPDFTRILDEHYDEVRAFKARKSKDAAGRAASAGAGGGNDDEQEEETKVGVFFCGTPVVGEILADRCASLSARGRADGSKIEYHFMMEVFG